MNLIHCWLLIKSIIAKYLESQGRIQTHKHKHKEKQALWTYTNTVQNLQNTPQNLNAYIAFAEAAAIYREDFIERKEKLTWKTSLKYLYKGESDPKLLFKRLKTRGIFSIFSLIN